MQADLRARLRGVTVPVVTPFDSGLAIDWATYDRHLKWLLAQGARGLLAADLVGEAWALTLDEKAALVERTVQVAQGRALVVAKLSEPALKSAAWLGLSAARSGADAIKVVLPRGVRPADAEAYEYLVGAADPSGLPFLVESNGTDVSFALLDRLAEHPRFGGIEETTQDLERVRELVERYGQDVPVLAGSEDALGFTLLLGVAGFMTATPNFAPAFMLALWEAAEAGDATQVLERYARLARFRRLLRPDLQAGHPVFASYAKAALDLSGHPVGPPRPPLRPLSSEERARLADVLRQALALDALCQETAHAD